MAKDKRHNNGEEAFLFWCKALKLPIPARNLRFHPIRKFEIDFAWPEQKIGVEINGAVFSGGGHARPLGIIRDYQKSNLLVQSGWRVLRFIPSEIISGKAMREVQDLLCKL